MTKVKRKKIIYRSCLLAVVLAVAGLVTYEHYRGFRIGDCVKDRNPIISEFLASLVFSIEDLPKTGGAHLKLIRYGRPKTQMDVRYYFLFGMFEGRINVRESDLETFERVTCPELQMFPPSIYKTTEEDEQGDTDEG